MGKLLVAEDDAEMARLLERGLVEEGYEVTLAPDGMDALIQAARNEYAAVVLDVMLPGMSGIEVCRRLRESQPLLPILLLTARDAVSDRVRGLDAGADDYLTKPFAFTELTARLRSIRRREHLVPAKTLRVGNLSIDNHDHVVSVAGAKLPLSPKEFALLRLLAQHANETITRDTILTEIWGSVEHTDPNVVDQYMSYLRRKLEPTPATVTISTVRGVGFTLAAPSLAAPS